MTQPVLEFLGKTPLELGPAANAEPDKGWRVATDDDGVVWMALDVEGRSTNTVTAEVLQGLSEQVGRIEIDKPRGVVIRSAKPGGFAAGADIGMLSGMTDEQAAREELRQAHAILDRLEKLDCPTIAIVHGDALGAGFEIALACDTILAIGGARFGFPEVNLGLHPGLGGTFRLPNRIDATEAMTMMLTGKSARTKKARKLGIADKVIEERHVANAVRTIVTDGIHHESPGFFGRAMKSGTVRSFAAGRMRDKAEERAPRDHYPAPHALIDLWDQHHGDRRAMQSGEIESFARLLFTDTTKNLIRVFHLRNRLKSDAPDADDIVHVHVIGAGEMGGAIAGWCAMKGKRVTLTDPDWSKLSEAMGIATEMCKRGHLSSMETRDTLDRLTPDTKGHGIGHADLVIEAGPENAKVKAAIYADVEPKMKQNAILATNTSSLSLSALKEGLQRPTRFAGLHFFNPVGQMPLVEVVSTGETYGTVTDTLAGFCDSIGKLPARVSDAPGFLVNRALMPYLLEAVLLIDEGVQKEAIDLTAERFGMPMGPVELADRVGLDICLDVAESLRDQVDKPLPAMPDWFRKMVQDDGKTGKKSGEGFYTWKNGDARKTGNAEPETRLTDRLILPMVDACVECLRKDVAKDAEQVDAAMIFGTGFAPFRGGPLHYARQRGVNDVCARLDELAKEHGDRFKPDRGWSHFA